MLGAGQAGNFKLTLLHPAAKTIHVHVEATPTVVYLHRNTRLFNACNGMELINQYCIAVNYI